MMRGSPDQSEQTDKGGHNKTFAGAFKTALLVEFTEASCARYLPQIKTTPLMVSSEEHAALWRRHMLVLHTCTHMKTYRISPHACSRCHTTFHDMRQHIVTIEKEA